jgi:pimeloyl-ACP methyl ester carboxylesterase
MRFMTRSLPRFSRVIVRSPLLRELAFAVPLSVGSRRMPATDALRAIEDLATAQAFEETFESTATPFSGCDIVVPVTVAFGDRDWILTKGSRRRNALPPHTKWVEKHGWGHVPMWVDPAGVAELILAGTQSAVR